MYENILAGLSGLMGRHGVDVRHVFADGSGNQKMVSSAIEAALGSRGIYNVGSGEALGLTEVGRRLREVGERAGQEFRLRVRHGDERFSDTWYGDRPTEILGNLAEFVRGGARGLPERVEEQICTRELAHTTPMRVTTKKEQPGEWDEMDAAAVLCTGLRERYGFHPGAPAQGLPATLPPMAGGIDERWDVALPGAPRSPARYGPPSSTGSPRRYQPSVSTAW